MKTHTFSCILFLDCIQYLLHFAFRAVKGLSIQDHGRSLIRLTFLARWVGLYACLSTASRASTMGSPPRSLSLMEREKPPRLTPVRMPCTADRQTDRQTCKRDTSVTALFTWMVFVSSNFVPWQTIFCCTFMQNTDWRQKIKSSLLNLAASSELIQYSFSGHTVTKL